MDGGEDQAGLVSIPSQTIQMFSSSQPLSVREVPDADTLKTGDEDEYTVFSHRDQRIKAKYSAHPKKIKGMGIPISYNSKQNKVSKLDFSLTKTDQNPGSNQEVPSVRSQ